MPLPLPNLDDRRWLDLTQEAIPLIPRYAPQWTDFNTHDPGITLMELFAWLTESMVYRLNQVPDRFKWKFLAFIGYPRRGPEPAWTVLAFQPIPSGTQFEVPAGAQFAVPVAGGSPIQFSTARAINLSPVTLSAIQVDGGDGLLRDYSRDLSDGLPITVMGAASVPGAALYLGFDAIPSGVPVAFWLWFDGAGHDAAERARINAEAAAQKTACEPVVPGWNCGAVTPPADIDPCMAVPAPAPQHHSARVVWEAFTSGTWIALDPVDDTRSLTLNGLVEFNLPASITQTILGAVATPLYYLRCRLASGAYDTPVVLGAVQPNAVAAVQRTPVLQQFIIAGTVLPLPTPPIPGQQISLQFTLSADLTIQTLSAQTPPTAGQPVFTFLNYVAPVAGNAGSITVEFAALGIGTAVPSQQVYIPGAPVVAECLRLYTHDGTNWTAWQQTADFDAARRTDLLYTLDPTTGLVICGDGERGQVFPQSSAIVVTGFATLAESGNTTAHRISGLAKTPVNEVVLKGVSTVDQTLLAGIAANPVAAAGGEAAASLTELEGEAAEVVHAHERILDLAENAQQATLDQIPESAVLALPAPSQAVNLLDTERIALDVPGTVVARARAWPDTDPAFPGIHATGVVTVVILPDMPVAEPMPSTGLIAAVKRYLDRRRVICTRIEVAAPTYEVITVTANVQSSVGAKLAAVEAAILAALDGFLNPLTGGPAGLGWPFGRSVYRAEILQLIANVPGVDHVNSMTLSADSGTPQCGDITLCPAFLVTSGAHQIQVVTS
jgi:predicted phage baseplate assembly protein